MGAVAGVILAVVTCGPPGRWVASSAGQQAYVEHPLRGEVTEPLALEHGRRSAWSPVRRLREPRVFLADDLPAVSMRVAKRGDLQVLGLSAMVGGVAGGLAGGAAFLWDRGEPRALDLVPWLAGGAVLGSFAGLARIVSSDAPPDEADLVRRAPEDVRVVRVRLAGVSF